MSIKIGDMELSELLRVQEQYCLVKVGKIKLFGELVKSLREETLSKNLLEVPTVKHDRIKAALVGRRR